MFSLRQVAFFLLTFSLVLVSSAAQRSYFNVTGSDFLEKTKFIFVGKLIHQESYRSDSPPAILTRHMFEVGDSIKGDPGRYVEITTLGGTVGDLRLTISHGTHYSPGQEYLVFSYVGSHNHNLTLAGPLGRFRVISDKSGKRMIRIYSSHPLVEVLGKVETPTFQDVKAFSNKLRDTLEKSSR